MRIMNLKRIERISDILLSCTALYFSVKIILEKKEVKENKRKDGE